MKLEKALIELSTLTDYGTQYLTEREHILDNYVPMRDVIEMSLDDFMETQGMDTEDVLRDLDESEILDYVRFNFDPTDLVYEDDLLEWAENHWEIGDIYSSADIKNYVADNFNVEDLVKWSW